MASMWGRGERVDASHSAVPATECIGAGRLEGWFTVPAYTCDKRGWGHIQSFCFEGNLFFHLQRSPLLRGVDFQKKDPVTFEVIEVNGRCEAVKLMTQQQMDEEDAKARGDYIVDRESGKPEAKEFVGQRVEGTVQSQYQ